MSETNPAHTCEVTSDGGWSLLAACPEDGGAGSIIGIVIGVVVLAAAGVGIWWLVNRRNS